MIIFLATFIAIYSLLIEYNNYKKLTQFDSALVDATLLKHYEKSKKRKNGTQRKIQILKLKAKRGYTFYSSTKSTTKLHVGEILHLEIWIKRLTFYHYLSGFYAFSKILSLSHTASYKEMFNTFIANQHSNSEMAHIYQALFSAKSLEYTLQKKFSELGISHLIAISGFHLGVLSFLLFFLLKYPYQFFQNRYFPYRNYTTDSFFIIATLLLSYLLFLDAPPSILRAFSMLIIGFLLHDRGIKTLSMQTLFLSAIFLISFFPRLLFSIGFWLSIAGVFYIFLFLIYFKHRKKIWQFIYLPFWVYLLMLPYSLTLFVNFSLYHPLSILWSSLFTLFYPLSIALHLVGYGDTFDPLLVSLLSLNIEPTIVHLKIFWLLFSLLLSILSIFNKTALYFLLLYSFALLLFTLLQ